MQQLKLTHDDSKLLVVHTAPQDRRPGPLRRRPDRHRDQAAAALAHPAVGGQPAVRRRHPAHLRRRHRARRPLLRGDQRLRRRPAADQRHRGRVPDRRRRPTCSRCGSRAPSTASTRSRSPSSAVYIGGHFQWNESPTAPDPWPGLDDVGYGTGQGLAAYAPGRRGGPPRPPRRARTRPTARRWSGTRARTPSRATRRCWPPRAACSPVVTRASRAATASAGSRSSTSTRSRPRATPTPRSPAPIEGRVVPGRRAVRHRRAPRPATGTWPAGPGRGRRRGSQYLQDDLTTWAARSTRIDVDLGDAAPAATDRLVAAADHRRQPREIKVRAKAFDTNGSSDADQGDQEDRDVQLRRPAADAPASPSPSSTLQTSTSFVLARHRHRRQGRQLGRALHPRHATRPYLTEDGDLVDGYTTFRIEPDNPGATSTTWQHEVNLPHEGDWKIGAMARDTAGQNDARWDTRDYTVDSLGPGPDRHHRQPVAVTPPVDAADADDGPGGRVTFTGTATDDQALATVEVTLRNSTTRENLASDGTWGDRRDPGLVQDLAGQHEPGVATTGATPRRPTSMPGTYTFQVRATDKLDLTTSSNCRAGSRSTWRSPATPRRTACSA